jgi:hypothetical protein
MISGVSKPQNGYEQHQKSSWLCSKQQPFCGSDIKEALTFWRSFNFLAQL